MLKRVFILLSFALSNISFADIPVIPTSPNINDWHLVFLRNDSKNASMTIHYGVCEFNSADMRIKAYICPMPLSEVKIAAKKYAPILVPKDKLDEHGKVLIHYTVRIFDVVSPKATRQETDTICEIDSAKNQDGVSLNEKVDKNIKSIITCKPEAVSLE